MGKARDQDVFEAIDLLADRRVDPRIRVAEQVDPPGADAVEVAPALEVFEPYALAARDRHERQLLVILHLRAGMPDDCEIAGRDCVIGGLACHRNECMRLEAANGAG